MVLSPGCSALVFIIALDVDPSGHSDGKATALGRSCFRRRHRDGNQLPNKLDTGFSTHRELVSSQSVQSANFSKTKLLSTDPDRPPLLTVLPPTWREVKFTRTARQLLPRDPDGELYRRLQRNGSGTWPSSKQGLDPTCLQKADSHSRTE